MRFARNVAFGLFSIALMGFGNVFADEIDDVLEEPASSSTTTTSTSTTASIAKPTFTVSFPRTCSPRYGDAVADAGSF
jgi:hypothetical protein